MRSFSSKTLVLALFMLAMFASDVMMVKAKTCTVELLPTQVQGTGTGSVTGSVTGVIPGVGTGTGTGSGSVTGTITKLVTGIVPIPGASCDTVDDCKSLCAALPSTGPLPLSTVDCGTVKCQ